MEASTAENSAFKRKTHCKHGHPLSGDNVRVDARTGGESLSGVRPGEPAAVPGHGKTPNQ